MFTIFIIYYFSLEKGANDEECTLKNAFKVVLDKFSTRILDCIEIEFLAAACLDPQQVFASYTSKFLEKYGTTVQKVLKDVIVKYELNTDINTPNQGAHNSGNIEMVNIF